MKLAITIWSNRVAPVFDVAGHLLIIEKMDGGDLEQQLIDLPKIGQLDRISLLQDLGIDELICGAISKPVYRAVLNCGVKVYPFVAGELDKVIAAWQHKMLESLSYSMPGCRHRRCCSGTNYSKISVNNNKGKDDDYCNDNFRK